MTHVRLTYRLYGSLVALVECVNCAPVLHPDGTAGKYKGMRWEPTDENTCSVEGSECLHLEIFSDPGLPQPQIKGWA